MAEVVRKETRQVSQEADTRPTVWSTGKFNVRQFHAVVVVVFSLSPSSDSRILLT